MRQLSHDAGRMALPAPALLINVLFAMAALVIFGATFRAGTERGMDQLVTWEGYGRVLNAVAAVMTQEPVRCGRIRDF